MKVKKILSTFSCCMQLWQLLFLKKQFFGPQKNPEKGEFMTKYSFFKTFFTRCGEFVI